jgi:hypothetical protein
MSELTIWEQIAAPLDPSEIKVRDAGKTQVPYIDKTSVEIRLNTVCPGDWHFQVTPIVVPADGSKGSWVVKGTLTIQGVTREDFGMNDNETSFDPPKAAVSDALKRCAALFGFARELAEDPKGSIAKMQGTQTGKSNGNGKPPQAAPKPATAAPTQGNGSSQGEAPESATEGQGAPETDEQKWATLRPLEMSKLSGQELYFIQSHAWSWIGMNHSKHFNNRWLKRFPGAKTLKDIPGTVGDFLMAMADAVAAEPDERPAE